MQDRMVKNRNVVESNDCCPSSPGRELVYIDDSPEFRQVLDNMAQNSDQIKTRWKKILEATSLFVRAKRNAIEAEDGMMKTILCTAPTQFDLEDLVQFHAGYFSKGIAYEKASSISSTLTAFLSSSL